MATTTAQPIGARKSRASQRARKTSTMTRKNLAILFWRRFCRCASVACALLSSALLLRNSVGFTSLFVPPHNSWCHSSDDTLKALGNGPYLQLALRSMCFLSFRSAQVCRDRGAKWQQASMPEPMQPQGTNQRERLLASGRQDIHG